MLFNIVSLFPEFFDSPLSSGLMGKAVERGVVSFNRVNPRDFATDRHKHVDDKPYGGGPGMVMFPSTVSDALKSLERPGRILNLTPRGKPFTQSMARDLAKSEAVTLVCGRYEGIDARLGELFPIEDVSIGDYVINGGETAAMCLIEAIARLAPGFMGKLESGDEESFSKGLLEYPHYTRPDEFEGVKVPDVLLSGDHGKVAKWRRERSLEITLERRPDLLGEAWLDKHDLKFLREIPRKKLGRNLYICLLHHPVLDKRKKTATVSLTNLDVHDISRCSRTYGMGGFYVATPLEDQQELARKLLKHWVSGPGSRTNPDRAEALGLTKVASGLDEIIEDVTKRTGETPKVVATSAQGAGSRTFGQVRGWLERHPVLLVLGTSHGLAPAVFKRVDGVLRPVRCLDGYNHLSVRSAASIMIDRLLNDIY